MAFFYICLRNCMTIIPSHTVVLTNKDKPWINPLLKFTFVGMPIVAKTTIYIAITDIN